MKAPARCYRRYARAARDGVEVSPEGVIVTRACLSSGDYCATGADTSECVARRKTLDDFVACCTFERRRFWAELKLFALL